MGIEWSTPGGLTAVIEATSQRLAYNNFRKTQVLFRKIVDRTPVRSGSLRASWTASYGSPDYAYVDRSSAEKRAQITPMGKPVFNLKYDRDKAWNIQITNPAPYASRIENGWSQQAPVGMVRISVMEVFGSGLR